jgi:hypothetical protein
MKLGILESKEDDFARDVAARFGGNAEFIVIKENRISFSSDFRVVLDRIGFNNTHMIEYMKSLSLNRSYIINNPFSYSMINKVIDSRICDMLRIPHPKTIALPMVEEGLEENLQEPDLDKIIKEIDLPCILKPHNGYAWDNVYVVNSVSEFKNLYNSLKGDNIMIAQEMIEKKDYYRVFCVGKKDVLIVKYDPKPRCLGEYLHSDLKGIDKIKDSIIDWTIKLNQALDLDINAVEWCIDGDGRPFVIDAFNETPEIEKKSLPQEYYGWILDRVCNLIKERMDSGERNRNIFSGV